MPLNATQLAELIEIHAAALVLWVRSRCAAGEDVVQEAFCRLAAQEPAPDNPVAWLYTVSRNLAEKQRRSDRRREMREMAWMRTESSSSTDPLEVAEMVAAVEQLEAPLREVLVARIWGGLSVEEVGRLCGISVASVSRRYYAALEALRAKLEVSCEKES
jgi:RNA polymerase sigma-70 factor (ECF subfamily)